MSRTLDMSLDEMIRNNRRFRGHNGDFRGRGRGSGFGSGPDRRAMIRGPMRTHPYPMRQPLQVREQMWQQQMIPIGGSDIEEGAKLYISNLDYGVSNEDIKLLFSEVGDLQRYSIHYDRSGRSKGTAEVVFFRKTDALAAIKRYNNVQLDGKPIKIELVGVNFVTPAPMLPPKSSTSEKPYGAFGRGQERAGGRGWVCGGGGGGGSGGSGSHGSAREDRGRGRRYGEKLSAEDLDADLENYHLEAMQIN